MKNDGEPVSAFAVYSGLANLSKQQRKRRRIKEKKNQALKDVKKAQVKYGIEKKKLLAVTSAKNGVALKVTSPYKKLREKFPHENEGTLYNLKQNITEESRGKQKEVGRTQKIKQKIDTEVNHNNLIQNKGLAFLSGKEIKPQTKSKTKISKDSGYNGVNIVKSKQRNNKIKEGLSNSTVTYYNCDIPEKKKEQNVAKGLKTHANDSICSETIIDLNNTNEVCEASPTKSKKETSNSPKKKSKVFRLSSNINYKLPQFTNKKQKAKHSHLMAQANRLLQAETSSEQTGKLLFEKLIAPFKTDDFMRGYWEKQAVYIERNGGKAFEPLISTSMIDSILRGNVVMFGKHLDVTSYSDGKRETHNIEGRAHAHVIWDYYSNGCSIRLLNPQFFIHTLHSVLAALQEYFGCLVGANAYLTPPNSQGFAPHYDDIEAFVLQVEGQKKWKIYNPRCKAEELPRFSSPNFKEDELGQPSMEVILSPGDVLYFPRGFIHQASTLPGQHSLHITVSTYQKTSWCDLLEKAIAPALRKAAESDVEFRRGLPLGYLKHAGAGRTRGPLRSRLLTTLKTLISKLEAHVNLDAAVDALGVQFMHDALPPVFTDDEVRSSVFNGGSVMRAGGIIENKVQLNLKAKVRLLRSNFCRLVREVPEFGAELEHRLYYSVDNSCEYHAEDPQFIVIPEELVPSIQVLINTYPKFTTVQDLPSPSPEAQVTLSNDLWERGLLMTDIPLEEEEEEDDTVGDDDADEEETSSISDGSSPLNMSSSEDEDDLFSITI